VIDLRHPAELVPGYTGSFRNTGARVLEGFADLELDLKLGALTGYIIWLIPAYLYRLSIKSTCWLYLPLVYVAGERDFAATPAHFVDRLISGGWEWWRRILASLTPAAFILTTLASAQDFVAFVMNKVGLPANTIRPLPDKIISQLEFMFDLHHLSGNWWQY